MIIWCQLTWAHFAELLAITLTIFYTTRYKYGLYIYEFFKENLDYENQATIDDDTTELTRRGDVNDQSAVAGDYDYEERRPRGLWAALFGYPDEFDGKDPAKFSSTRLQEGKRQSSETSVRGRTIAGFGNTRDFKKSMASMSKAFSTTAPKSTANPFKAPMLQKQLSLSSKSPADGVDNSTVDNDFSRNAKNFSQDERLLDTNYTLSDDQMVKSDNNNTDDAQKNATMTEDDEDSGFDNQAEVDSVNNVKANSSESSRTSGSNSNKREANPSGSTNGPNKQPIGNQLQPLPAGYILWHPVPAGQYRGPGLRELPVSSDRSQTFLPPSHGDGGPSQRDFVPHRPMFVEPPSRDFMPNAPMPITEFSSPPVFAIMPDQSRHGDDNDDDQHTDRDRSSNNRERNKKSRKGSKNRNRSKGRRPQNSDQPEFLHPPPMLPVHVMLPPLPPNDFNDPNFGPRFPPHFSPHHNNGQEREQFIPNGPFPNQRPQQSLRQPGFQQEQPIRDHGFQREQAIRQPGFQQEQAIRESGFQQPQPLREPGFQQGQLLREPGFQQDQPLREPGFQEQQPIREPGFRQQQPIRQPGFQGEQSIRQPQFQPQRNQPAPHEFPNNPQHLTKFHNGPLIPERQNDNGLRGQNSKRPSPTPSAHPAKFEIDRVKKLQEHFENRPNAGLLPVSQRPPFPLSTGFPPHPNSPRPFDFTAAPQSFTLSSSTPQFLDGNNDQHIRHDSKLLSAAPLGPTQGHSSFGTTPTPFNSDLPDPVHVIPPLPLPPPETFPQDVGGDFGPITTPQSMFPENDDVQGLLYTRDFRKQANEIGLTTTKPRPQQFTSTTKRPPIKTGASSQFTPTKHVQRFPAIPHSSKLSSPRGQQGKKNIQRNNQQPNTLIDQPAIWHPLNRPQGAFTEDQKRDPQQLTNDVSLAASHRLPDTHPNLPDFKYQLGPVDRHISTSTTVSSGEDQDHQEQDNTWNPNESNYNYASPGFHTGHKGYPSSVTAPNFITPANDELDFLQPTTSQRPWSATQLPRKENLVTSTTKPKNFFGTTFQSSFVSTSRDSTSPNRPSYHYEIKYQTPSPQQRIFTGATSKSLLSSSSNPTGTSATHHNQGLESITGSVTTHAPFGLDKEPEYASPTFQPAQGQGGAYRPGTSRILLEMGQWKHKSDDEQTDSPLLDFQATQ